MMRVLSGELREVDNYRLGRRDILTPMNYRRGLKRIYAVLTVAWVVIVLLTVLTGRWEPWLRLQPKTLPADFSAWDEPKKMEFSPSELRPFTPPPLSSLQPTETSQKSPASPDIFDRIAREQFAERWKWALGLSLLTPAVMYLLLFHVSRWIYRGFQPATHN
jgi:hypothetical protein